MFTSIITTSYSGVSIHIVSRSCDSPRTVHQECNPFPVPPGDHYYPEVNITSGERMCFPFMRSLPGQQKLGPREQVNQNTAFLDASQIYGENPCVLRDLKGQRGKMNYTTHPVKGKDLLPLSDKHPECKSASGQCFIAGKERCLRLISLLVWEQKLQSAIYKRYLPPWFH